MKTVQICSLLVVLVFGCVCMGCSNDNSKAKATAPEKFAPPVTEEPPLQSIGLNNETPPGGKK